MRIVVLGAGLVGATMARDLADEAGWKVTVADVSAKSIRSLKNDPRIRLVRADLSRQRQVAKLASGSDLVIGALPGFMGFKTLETVIKTGKNIVDISFFPEDPFRLDRLAKKKSVTAIVDCGVAPGCSNMLTGHAVSLLDKTHNALCYVGGLPRARVWPYEYRIVFSALDVIEEYLRPARYIENGKLVVKPALSDPELLDFPGVGTLEAFNTDGLRTLADTIDAPNMKEKTMRYPGHIEKMKLLRDTGFFGKEPVKIGRVSVRPIDVTAKILFPVWKLQDDEQDFTVMRVIVEGIRRRKRLRYTYDLYDTYDVKTGTTSMARTTGYACTVAARMVCAGVFSQKGVCPPEYIGRNEKAYQFMIDGMKKRNIVYRETISRLL